MVDDRDRPASQRRRCRTAGSPTQGRPAPTPAGPGARFQRILEDLQAESFSVELWGTAEAIVDQVSEDHFFEFRGWLITQGQRAYQAAIADPDSLVDLPELGADEGMLAWGEAMWFVASEVHEERTGGELPPEACWTTELIGNWWPYEQHQEQLRRRYPRLWARFRATTHP